MSNVDIVFYTVVSLASIGNLYCRHKHGFGNAAFFKEQEVKEAADVVTLSS